MYKIKFIIAIVISASIMAAQGAQTLTGIEIITKSEKAVRGDAMIGSYEITVKTRRWTRVMSLKSWDDRIGKKSFSEITSPKKDAGNRFLMIEKNLFHFVPKLQKEIKISPSMMLQSWMGSDFTNDDIVKESSIIEDYTHTLVGKETVDGLECYKVELVPKKDAAVVWGKIVYYSRTADFLPVKEEFYSEHGDLKKVMIFSAFKIMHGRVIPTVYRMQTVNTPDRYTLMEIKDVRFDEPFPPNVFTLQNLKRK